MYNSGEKAKNCRLKEFEKSMQMRYINIILIKVYHLPLPDHILENKKAMYLSTIEKIIC
jgi:hypothetical protein